MAKREEFVGNIECGCGAKGHATYEENENPAHAGWQLETELINVSKGFTMKEGKAFCDKCGKHVHTHA